MFAGHNILNAAASPKQTTLALADFCHNDVEAYQLVKPAWMRDQRL